MIGFRVQRPHQKEKLKATTCRPHRKQLPVHALDDFKDERISDIQL